MYASDFKSRFAHLPSRSVSSGRFTTFFLNFLVIDFLSVNFWYWRVQGSLIWSFWPPVSLSSTVQIHGRIFQPMTFLEQEANEQNITSLKLWPEMWMTAIYSCSLIHSAEFKLPAPLSPLPPLRTLRGSGRSYRWEYGAHIPGAGGREIGPKGLLVMSKYNGPTTLPDSLYLFSHLLLITSLWCVWCFDICLT